ncbi:alpha/beta fold hydrolase [Aeoliella sp.]|uniref:alpha/beta fold hydrolase n=1 Tax=Aeoliella sp. TaxID=2795800 RepID=UPI003CCBD06C
MTLSPTIYLLPGVAKDYPVFARIAPLLPEATIVRYPMPRPGCTLTEYARRIAVQLEPNSFLVGVSFGGVLAQELAGMMPAKGCVVVASVRGPHQLPRWSRVLRSLGTRNCNTLFSTAGRLATSVPRSIRTGGTVQARQFAGEQGAWHRWAASSVINWQPTTDVCDVPTLQIHGTADTTFPIRYIDADVVVDRGRHALPVSHPEETAEAIREFIEQVA